MMDDSFHLITPWQDDCVFEAVAVLVKDEHGRIAIHFRDDFEHVIARGKWGYFAGKVEKDETLVRAAIRELFEETGIRADINEMQPFAKAYSCEINFGAHHYIYILDRIISPAEISLNEGAGFAFVHSGQIDKFDLQPVVKRVLSYYFSAPRSLQYTLSPSESEFYVLTFGP